jgi:hypothetical protein
MELLATFALGLVAGLLTPVLQRRLRRASSWMKHIRGSGITNVDATDLGFFVLNQWSYRRPLRTEDIVQTVVPVNKNRRQSWCDDDALSRLRDGLEDEGGPACTLVDLEIDHRESDRGKKLRLKIAPSMYGDFIAVHDYFAARPQAVAEMQRRLENEPIQELIRQSPSSVMVVNATVTSADGYVLAMQRSAAVRKWQNVWGIGAHETMALPTGRPGDSEDFFGATQRCLREEVGIEPGNDYGEIVVSWMGYWVANALIHVISHVKSTLPAAEISSRVGESYSSFETSRLLWIPDTRASLGKVVRESLNDVPKRKWLPTAPLAAQQYWRCRPALD